VTRMPEPPIGGEAGSSGRAERGTGDRVSPAALCSHSQCKHCIMNERSL
jgi:hypothetical protein